jgi:hypothetical protein
MRLAARERTPTPGARRGRIEDRAAPWSAEGCASLLVNTGGGVRLLACINTGRGVSLTLVGGGVRLLGAGRVREEVEARVVAGDGDGLGHTHHERRLQRRRLRQRVLHARARLKHLPRALLPGPVLGALCHAAQSAAHRVRRPRSRQAETPHRQARHRARCRDARSQGERVDRQRATGRGGPPWRAWRQNVRRNPGPLTKANARAAHRGAPSLHSGTTAATVAFARAIADGLQSKRSGRLQANENVRATLSAI